MKYMNLLDLLSTVEHLKNVTSYLTTQLGQLHSTITAEIEENKIVNEIKKIGGINLKTSIFDFPISTRLHNTLKSQSKIETIEDLLKTDKKTLREFRNFGKKGLEEVERLLKSLGLALKDGDQ